MRRGGEEDLLANVITLIDPFQHLGPRDHRLRLIPEQLQDLRARRRPELVQIAGGYDPLGRKHRPSTQVDWQDVLDARPEIILLALCGYDVARARHAYELLRQCPGFGSIPAAQTGEIYVVNASAYFSRPGPRILDSLEILAGILHPSEFSEFAPHGPDDPRVVRAG